MADKIQIEIDAEAQEAIDDFNKLNKATETQTATIKELEANLKKLKTARDKATDPRAVAILNKRIDQTNKRIKTATANTSKFGRAFGNVKKAVGALAGAIASIRAISFLKDATKSFADFRQASDATAKQFGKNSKEIIKALRNASDGTISNNDLITTANRALALNVTKDIGQVAQLLEFARVRARALGTDTTSAFNDIVTGIGRGSPLILDNLGIMTTGWAELAKEQGVAFDSQFVLNKVLEDSAKTLEQIGPLILTPAERFSQFQATIDNATTSLGEAFLPVAEGLLKILVPIIDGFAGLSVPLRGAIAGFTALIPAVIGLSFAFGPIGLTIGLVTAGLVALGIASSTAGSKILTLEQAQKRLIQVNKDIAESQKLIEGGNVSFGIGAIIPGQAKRDLENAKKALEDLQKEREGLIKSIEEQTEAEENLNAIKGRQKEINDKQIQAEKASLSAFLISKEIELDTEAKVLAEKKRLLEQFATEKEAIEASSQLRIKAIKEKEAEDERKLRADTVLFLAQNATEAIGIASDAIQNRIDSLTQARDTELALIDEQKQAVLSQAETQGQSSEQIDAIEAQFAQKKKEREDELNKQIAIEKTKQAKADKANALFNIAIQGAIGIAGIWGRFGKNPIVAGILTGILSGIIGAQLAVVGSKPLPKFREGTSSAPQGLAVVGEDGPEIVNFAGGEGVIPNDQTQDIINNNSNQNVTINLETNDPVQFMNRLKQEYGLEVFQQ